MPSGAPHLVFTVLQSLEGTTGTRSFSLGVILGVSQQNFGGKLTRERGLFCGTL